MEGDLIKLNEWLTPLSWVYRLGVGIRNTMFELGILTSKSYDVPIVSIGNITAGGTGKTPHTEYLIQLLSQTHRVGVLSRGYKRRSHGYVLAGTDTPMEQLGDEPWQMKQKFPAVYVAVDKSRRRGIKQLCEDEATRDVEVILLDDAYQHRYVTPDINILLVDYHRMITDDRMLPVGRLREPLKAKERANMVIITKCPHDIKPMDFRVIQKALNLRPYQTLFFSSYRYGGMKQLFGNQEMHVDDITKEHSVLLLTGIASPEQMMIDLKQFTRRITPMAYPDHHYFKPKDISRINQTFAAMPQPRIIVTTEKDAARLNCAEGLSEEVRQALYVLPIEVEILRDETKTFNEKITGYVLKNPRNSILAKG